MRCHRTLQTTIKSLILLLFSVYSLFYFGCSVVGQTVPVERRIQLVSGEIQKGVWKAQGLTVTYGYRITQKDLNLPGSIDIAGGLKYDFGSTDSLDVWINFLDEEGKILNRRILYSSGYKTSSYGSKDRLFNEKLETPPKTAGISFSHVAMPRSGHQ